MSYDKKTGEVKIEQGKGAQGKAAAKKKVIGSIDDLETERKALF
jgi:hypothetical protein